MKLIATKDFFNARVLGLTIAPTEPGFQDAQHVHKGLRFTYGKSEDYDGLLNAEKEVVMQLVAAKAIIYDLPANTAKIKRLDEQVAIERAAKAKDNAKKPSMEELIAGAVATALAQAGVIKAPAK